MKKQTLLLSFLVIATLKCIAQPPYSGSIFVDPDIVTTADSSALESVAYSGMGLRTVFDRRVNEWVTINAFLFEVVWNDGLSSEAIVNPEFGTVALAEVEAEKYGWSIGQLPHCLRVDVDEIWIHQGVRPFGGGNRSILIHTGQTLLYENAGILVETLIHEAAHTSLDATHAASAGWLEAQQLDGGFITDYAEENPNREDVAESVLLWLAVRYRADAISTQDYNLITEAIPHRLAYFDAIMCNLYPFESGNPTAATEVEADANKIMVYPNPTNSSIRITLNDDETYAAAIYNSTGQLVLSTILHSGEEVDMTNFPPGVYTLVMRRESIILRKSILRL